MKRTLRRMTVRFAQRPALLSYVCLLLFCREPLPSSSLPVGEFLTALLFHRTGCVCVCVYLRAVSFSSCHPSALYAVSFGRARGSFGFPAMDSIRRLAETPRGYCVLLPTSNEPHPPHVFPSSVTPCRPCGVVRLDGAERAARVRCPAAVRVPSNSADGSVLHAMRLSRLFLDSHADGRPLLRAGS